MGAWTGAEAIHDGSAATVGVATECNFLRVFDIKQAPFSDGFHVGFDERITGDDIFKKTRKEIENTYILK